MVRILGVAAAAAFLTASASAATAPASSGRPNSRINSASNKPLFPGPYPPVPSGDHPSFPWPPPHGPAPQNPCNKVQYQFPAGTNANPTKANAVKAFYARVWGEYAQYCFGEDDINVIGNTCEDDLFGWGATIVDGVDTAIVMNLTDIAARQLAFIAQIDFTKANSLVDGFDAVIRYLGGLLSSYDLLTSGYVPKGTYNQAHVDALLTQAHTLGNKLKPQFQTKTGLPAADLNFTTNQLVESSFQDPLNNKTYPAVADTAQAGTLILEFERLADLTGDREFAELAERAESWLINPNPAPKYPGLVGSTLDIETGNYLTFDFGWHAGIDSFLEYLIKTYYYNPLNPIFTSLKNFWLETVDSSMKHIALHPYDFPELTFLSQADDAGNLEYAQDDYACFAGGNLLLGGAFLDMPDVMSLGYAVTGSCHQTYNTSTTGLGPAAWAWYNASNLAYDPSADNNAADRAMAAKIGYYYTDPEYAVFPETLESIFYAWRISGDTVWQDYSWEVFQALEASHGPGFTYAGVNNVDQPGSFQSYLPSFFFAEVMKYIYLTFTPPDVVSLDDYVFNTECHPLRRNIPYCNNHY